ncbi:MAG: threonine synthase [Candidatus Moranbacteria bacterium]|nr:threonine synthase [Candidatus Moranbacteria bacterium]
MKFYSTNNKNLRVDFKKAVLESGLAPDGGLYMPREIPELNKKFLKSLAKLEFNQIIFEIAKPFLEKEIGSKDLKKLIQEVFDFEIPLVFLSDNVYCLELFGGPTLAFKDFGARFMAKVISHLNKDRKKITVLVATSGDTGGAVANAFSGIENIEVVLLYPAKKISQIQEKQLTTGASNIKALEIKGVFDDCQAMVKKAFLDREVNENLTLIPANSINFARLLGQVFYYFYVYSKIQKPFTVSVPCGNFGNLTAGIMAKKMGLPVQKFVASLNKNNVFQDYLRTGKFKAKKSVQSLSSAMDIGNPSNFYRIKDLYDNDLAKMKKDIIAYSFSDDQTQTAIKRVFEKFDYLMDPHGAVAYLGLEKYLKDSACKRTGVFFETAHPVKFKEEVEKIINQKIKLPSKIKKILNKRKKSIPTPNKYSALKEILLQ